MTKKIDKKLNKGYKLRGGVAVVALMGVIYLASQDLVFAQNADGPVAAAAPTNPVSEQPQATTSVTPVETPAGPDAIPPQVQSDAAAIATVPEIDDTVLLATADAKRHVRDGSLMADDNFPTLFFTAWQHALLQEAKIGFIGSRTSGGGGAGVEQSKKDPGIREVSLGGIAFANAAKWTVWLNGVRVTPDAFPQQVLDLKVTQNYIDLKWFDNYTNRIYPIRLRPQERFNLDSRIFLPGAGVDKM